MSELDYAAECDAGQDNLYDEEAERASLKKKKMKIVSFGFRHGCPEVTPETVVVDLRSQFRNPFHNQKLRSRTGLDPEVQRDVMKTPEFNEKYARVKARVSEPGVEVAYIGCSGGRHRSVFLAERLGRELGVPVYHRDILKK